MQEKLRHAPSRVVGTKQVLKALQDGRVVHVFLGRDADSFLFNRVNALSEEKQVPVTVVDTMQELGKLCLIGVATAAAAVLK